MPIDTDFSFAHVAPAAVVPPDPRGLLAGFVGNELATKKAKRTWKGKGFNMIWRPNFGGASGTKDFFLEMNLTDEILEFTDITGTGIANRGLLQTDILLGGIAYLQQISDSFDNTGQHFEPGVWINVPGTTNPAEPTSVTRMGSIPHGATIELEGVSFTAPAPFFAPASITPFTVGSPDDGVTGLVHFPEETLATPSTSRTDVSRVESLTQPELTNPNVFLSDAIAGQAITSTSVLIVASQPVLLPGRTAPPVPPHVTIGGGTESIAFLTGAAAGPNADSTAVSATFWIETVKHHDGSEHLQIQYTQRVILTFNGLNWPHITVATLR